jgi:hypothetical protein
VDESRVSEIRELYEALGMETHVESGIMGADSQCDECFGAPAFARRYKTVYTRRPGSAYRTEHRSS